MFQLRDLIGAHFSAWTGRAHVLDDIRLPRWLDARFGWNQRRDRERLLHSERSAKRPPTGKDPTQDW